MNMKEKSKEEILEQLYVTAQDLKILIPKLGINNCRKFISEIQEEMMLKKYYIPDGKSKMALTKLVKKKFGL